MPRYFYFRSLIAVLVWLTPQFWTAALAQSSSVCPAHLDEQISAIVDRPSFLRMRWGVLIQTQAASGRQATLYAHDAERYFIPASNAKLLTTAAALERLGSQFRIRTSVYQIGAADDGTALRVVGRGDPSLTDTELQQLAQQLQDRQIQRVQWLIGDDQFFQGDPVNGSWEWEDVQAGYGTPSTSLTLNQNRIGLRLVPQQIGHPLRVEWDDPAEGGNWQIDNSSQTVGANTLEPLQVGRELHRSLLHVRGQLRVDAPPEPVAVSIPQPSQYFMKRLQQTLQANQIQVDRTALAVVPGAGDIPEVAAVESASLSALITIANQRSNNLYAEAILRSMGIHQSVGSNTLSSGLAALKATLTQLGVDPASYHLVDGSGLSRHNLVSPEAIVQTLQAMARSPQTGVYRDSLSIAGVNGTLRNSFRDTPIQNRLRGKTGSFTDVTSLSGYFEPPHYSPLVFSILINQGGDSMEQVAPAIDEILLLLARLQETC